MNALPGDSMNGTHRGRALVPVLEDVRGQGLQPRGRAVHRVDDRHGLLDPLALDVVEAGGRLVGGGVEFVLGDLAGELDRDQSGLEVDRHGRAVVDGAGEVVGVDDVAEDLLRCRARRSRSACR